MILKHKGITINYSSAGTGTAIVLLHGFLENKTMWNDFLPTLSEGHQVVTVDLLGHGETGCLGPVHSMEDMAESVHAVLKELKLKKSILIGHSMGGYVALAFAEKYPDELAGLCLMNMVSYKVLWLWKMI